MTCRERLHQLGVQILEVRKDRTEFVCHGQEGVDVSEVLESLDFWDYTSPLSAFTLRGPWWSGEYDQNDETYYLVMGDPEQEV